MTPAVAGPAIFRGVRLVIDPGDTYVVGCPWCRRSFTIVGPEVVDVEHLRAWHDRLHVAQVVNT